MDVRTAASSTPVEAHGPLSGLRVIELGGKGPTPFSGMLLADMGADVTVITRQGGPGPDGSVLDRGKSSVRADLRSGLVVESLLDAMSGVDVIIEGFRPGVAERLGLGPEVVRVRHPHVVFGRMTGYGQGGPYSAVAGHDINFIGMSTALAHIGPPDREPVVPLNLVGDFGGGGTFLVVGVLAALLERARSGRGQVVDAAMTDGSALLMASVYGLHAAGVWSAVRGVNPTDGSAPYYGVYRTADGHYVTVGALDARHRDALLLTCGIDPSEVDSWEDRSSWPALRARLEQIFASATRAEWERRFTDIDASVAPVLTLDEAWQHPFHHERGTFPVIDGVRQPAPAPRFDRTPSVVQTRGASDPRAVLLRLGVPAERADELLDRGDVG